jgi:magnesium-transporting ATPase (P-type)
VLNKLVPHHCHIIRDGEQIHLLANEVVPGDLITFTTGNHIPVDVCLLAAVDLKIDESSLTGETTARRKCTVSIPLPWCPWALVRCLQIQSTNVSQQVGHPNSSHLRCRSMDTQRLHRQVRVQVGGAQGSLCLTTSVHGKYPLLPLVRMHY